MIEFQDVSKSYDDGETKAVRNLSLYVAEGEFILLVGESGCGKTTTLKMINRLVEPTSGRILVDGTDITQSDPIDLRRSIGYVFQDIGLFPHMTVSENVAQVMHLLKRPKSEIARRVDELLELVGLPTDEFLTRMPEELSGGQQQRVGVARALAAKPRVMLMDEPFGALDPITRDSLQYEFQKLQRHLSLTVVMVTHDMHEALLLGDRIAVMEKGSLVGLGTPHELLHEPKHPYVESLISTPQRQADRLHEMSKKDEHE
jgi:osmoprotectant transport system ATP-binding protein